MAVPTSDPIFRAQVLKAHDPEQHEIILLINQKWQRFVQDTTSGLIAELESINKNENRKMSERAFFCAFKKI